MKKSKDQERGHGGGRTQPDSGDLNKTSVSVVKKTDIPRVRNEATSLPRKVQGKYAASIRGFWEGKGDRRGPFKKSPRTRNRKGDPP